MHAIDFIQELAVIMLIAVYRKLKALSMLLAELGVRREHAGAQTDRVRRVLAEVIPAAHRVWRYGVVPSSGTPGGPTPSGGEPSAGKPGQTNQPRPSGMVTPQSRHVWGVRAVAITRSPQAAARPAREYA